MTLAQIAERWRKRLGLPGWTLHIMEGGPPNPGRIEAYYEAELSTRTAKLWVRTEADIIHELCHVRLLALQDLHWHLCTDKRQLAAWRKREEATVKALERAFVAALREGRTR